jgi:hypothetical protein
MPGTRPVDASHARVSAQSIAPAPVGFRGGAVNHDIHDVSIRVVARVESASTEHGNLHGLKVSRADPNEIHFAVALTGVGKSIGKKGRTEAATIQREMIYQRGAAHSRNPLDNVEQTLLIGRQLLQLRISGAVGVHGECGYSAGLKSRRNAQQGIEVRD